MNCIYLILKILQFLISAAIGIFFVTPHTLSPNLEAFKNGSTPPTIKVDIMHLYCNVPTRFLRKAFSQNFSQLTDEAYYPFREYREPKIASVEATFACMENGTEAERKLCPCWNDRYEIMIVALISLLTALLSACDVFSLCGVEGQRENVTFLQGCASCFDTAINGAVWIIAGLALVFFFNRWPYFYETKSEPMVWKLLYQVPADWGFAMFLCFSFAILMVVEGAVYFLEVCRKKPKTDENAA